MKSLPRVYLKWVDSASRGETNWLDKKAFNPEDMDETICESLGWLVGETIHSYFIAGHIGVEEYGSVWQIPRGAVQEIIYLELP